HLRTRLIFHAANRGVSILKVALAFCRFCATKIWGASRAQSALADVASRSCPGLRFLIQANCVTFAPVGFLTSVPDRSLLQSKCSLEPPLLACLGWTRLRTSFRKITRAGPALSADGGALIFDRTTASSRRQSRVSAE